MQSPATTKLDKTGAGTASAPAPVRPSRPKTTARPAAPVAAPTPPAPSVDRWSEMSKAELDRLYPDDALLKTLQSTSFLTDLKRVMACGFGVVSVEVLTVRQPTPARKIRIVAETAYQLELPISFDQLPPSLRQKATLNPQ